MARGQLLLLGVTEDWIDHRIASGFLLRTSLRGVYALAHAAPARDAAEWEALLHVGPQAALALRSSGRQTGLLGAYGGTVEVASTADAGRGSAQVRVHRRRAWRDGDLTVVDGLRCTSPAETLVMLAHHHPRLVPRALANAERLTLHVGDLRGRAHGRPGARTLSAALDAFDPREARAKSELERRGIRLLRDARIEPFEANAWLDTAIGPLEVDLLLPDARIAIELDSEAFHSTPSQRRRDRERANAVTAAGHVVLRWDEGDLTTGADRTLAALRALRRERLPE